MSGIKEKIKEILAKAKEFFLNILSYRSRFSDAKLPKLNLQKPDFKTIAEKIKVIPGNLYDSANRFLERIPDGKRRPLILGVCGLFLVLIILAVAMNSGKKTKEPALHVAAGFAVPPEELFYPAEPDFVPEFYFEREPKKSWTIEDIRPYWKVPEKAEHWKEEVKSAVEKLLEGVP